MEPETIVIAIGGNSLIEDPHQITVESQYRAAKKTAHEIITLAAEGHRIILVHGNGPQVGFVLRRSEFSRKILHTVPLDSCVADTQGAIGYNLQMALYNEARERGIHLDAATVVTQVEVDEHDPSFRNPTKPIGSFMDFEDAEYHRITDGWQVVEDAGRGYRRVVPSPKPMRIVEIGTVRTLIEAGVMVIAAGGGGIPISTDGQGMISGREAVIDKDLAAALLAREMKVDRFMISTAVPKVCVHFGKPGEKGLDEITCAEAERYCAAGEFAPGSMLPKIRAMIEFVSATGNTGVITDPAHLHDAFYGQEGTRIVP